jgi:hypothetical protein
MDEPRFHYSLNLHQMMQIFKGMQRISPLAKITPPSLVRLWKHEMLRMFSDGLVNEQDRAWLAKTISTTIQSYLKSVPDLEEDRDVLFADFSINNPFASKLGPAVERLEQGTVGGNIYCFLYNF